MALTEGRALAAVRTITAETGYAPTPEELADALGVPTRSVHSALIGAKRRRLVMYDEDGRLVAGVQPPPAHREEEA